MKSYNVRELIGWSKDQIMMLPDGPIEITFDDGVLTTNARRTILSWFFWEFFRMDAAVPVKLRHHLGSARFTKKTQLKLLSDCVWDSINFRRKTQHVEQVYLEALFNTAYKVVNHIYNFNAGLLEPYVVTIDADDVIDVLDHPEIARINREVRACYESIADSHHQVLKVLKDETELPLNRIGESIRCGLVSEGQVLQCISPIGLRTAVDSSVYPVPVITNFSEGLVLLHDSMIESRSASKSLLYQKGPLQQVQYFNRELQLEACVVLNLHHNCDCGTKKTVPYFIKTPKYLDEMHGKWYYDERGELKMITPKDRHLVGKTVNMRSVRTCEHPDEQGVCSTCFGEISWSIPANSNIGHVSVVEICEKITQIVLSTKHLDSGVKVEDFVIQTGEEKYLEFGERDNLLRLRRNLKGRRPVLRFPAANAPNIAQIDITPDVNTLNPEVIANLTMVHIKTVPRDNVYIEETLTVSMGSRTSNFTLEFLSYLKSHTPRMGDGNMYEVDLEDWDFTLPVFRLPMKHRSMLEFKTDVERFIKATSPSQNQVRGTKSHNKRCGRKTDEQDFANVLAEFHSLVGSKLSINLVHMEVVLYSTMVRSSSQGDYRLPKPWHDAEFAAYADLMNMRSLAPVMAHQKQVDALTSVSSFLNTQRPVSPLDAILRG